MANGKIVPISLPHFSASDYHPYRSGYEIQHEAALHPTRFPVCQFNLQMKMALH